MLLQSKNCRLCSKNCDREKETKNPRPSKNYGCTLFCKNSRPAKNFGTSVGKPSGVVQVFRTSERIAGSTGEDAGTHDHNTTTAGEQESRRATNKFFALYIGVEKYLQKMLKKICRYGNLLYLCKRNNKSKAIWHELIGQDIATNLQKQAVLNFLKSLIGRMVK